MMGEQMMRRAQKLQDSAFLIEAHWALGETLLYLGELVPARAVLEQGITLYNPQQHHSHAFLYGQDPEVVCLIHAAWTLWLLGYPDRALSRICQALSLARKLSHPNTLGHALAATAFVHQLRREGQVTQEFTEESIALAHERGFPFWLALGTIWRGWSLAEQGQGTEGIIQIRQGIATWQSIGGEATRPYYLTLLAEACGRLGQSEEGLILLAEGLTHIDKTGERREEAELYRLKGALTLQSKVQGPKSKVQEAEACFLKAVDIARKQQAKSLELRAATSLARLWQQQGKQHEAHQMLSEVYNWFTEGFDTKDLQEANALLDALS
jgi:predicted ATPase